MLLFATFLPFFNFLLCSIFGRFLGRFGCTQIAVTNLFLGTFIFLVYTGTLSKTGNVCYLTVTSWIDCGLLYINWAFLYDSLSLSMLSMVVFISAFVHLYSSSYMESDPSYIRFLGYLSLFTFLMLVLLTSDNLIQLFFGWEGIGLASYLLISFWNTRVQANKAALKALLVNRIGDLGFLIATALIFFLFRSLEFSVIFPLAIFFESAQIVLFSTKWSFISLICFFLFIGSCGKSAQLGLHTWLPDAMEGPTPVSALIHAATLVTAGIYLVIRCSILFEMAPNTLTFITLIGASTAIFASSIGLFQYDLKKVIAYSTCSQLGYMCFTCGISQYHAAIFHLINHAFFKALLFLTAGVVIHALSGEQDMRRMGGLVAILPVTYNALLLGSLALMGFPFLSGFYSKDFILELSCSIHKFDSQAAFWLGSIAAYFTAFYSYRLLYLAFYSPSRSFFFYLRQVHELPPVMFFILNSLLIGTLFFGFFGKELFIGLGSCFFGNSLYHNPLTFAMFDFEFLSIFIKNIPSLFTFLGVFSGYISYSLVSRCYQYNSSVIILFKFFNNKWFFDHVYNRYVGYPILQLGYTYTYRFFDKGFLEIFGAFGLTCTIQRFVRFFKLIHNGSIYQYQLFMGISLLFLFFLGLSFF